MEDSKIIENKLQVFINRCLNKILKIEAVHLSPNAAIVIIHDY